MEGKTSFPPCPQRIEGTMSTRKSITESTARPKTALIRPKNEESEMTDKRHKGTPIALLFDVTAGDKHSQRLKDNNQ